MINCFGPDAYSVVSASRRVAVNAPRPRPERMDARKAFRSVRAMALTFSVEFAIVVFHSVKERPFAKRKATK